MPGPPFKSVQSVGFLFLAFFVAQPNSIFAFGFQFAIAIGHAKSVNYTMQQGSKAASGFFRVQGGGEG